MAEKVIEIQPDAVETVESNGDGLALVVDLTAYEGVSIPSNLARLTELCEEKAAEYKGIREIGKGYTYKDCKSDLAALRKSKKQIEDERKRVKSAFSLPLVEFESGVKSALRPMAEAEERIDKLIKEYEGKARNAKRTRLRAHWEQTYPALALCTGDAARPLVPFEQIECIDWTKRMSEVDAGRDVKVAEKMDALADDLARGAETIASLAEPEDVRADALSRLYRSARPVSKASADLCCDLGGAIDAAKEEARRRADMARLAEAQRQTRVPVIEPQPDPEPEPEPEPRHVPEPDPSEPIGYAVIPIYSRMQLDTVISVMKAAGISGTYKPRGKVHVD